MPRFDQLPDELFLIPILVGTGYAILVETGARFGLARLFPTFFGPRVRPLAIASASFGIGLILASAKYYAVDPAPATMYAISGLLLMLLAIWVWCRRRDV